MKLVKHAIFKQRLTRYFSIFFSLHLSRVSAKFMNPFKRILFPLNIFTQAKCADAVANIVLFENSLYIYIYVQHVRRPEISRCARKSRYANAVLPSVRYWQILREHSFGTGILRRSSKTVYIASGNKRKHRTAVWWAKALPSSWGTVRCSLSRKPFSASRGLRIDKWPISKTIRRAAIRTITMTRWLEWLPKATVELHGKIDGRTRKKEPNRSLARAPVCVYTADCEKFGVGIYICIVYIQISRTIVSWLFTRARFN